MVRIILTILMIAAAAAAFPISAVAQRGRKDIKNEQPLTEVVSPRSTFSRIEVAWRARDAEAISSFVGNSKVLVQIGAGDSGGFYSRSQVHHLLKRMFREYEQLRFEFAKFHNLDNPGRKVYAIAHRRSRALRSDKVFQDKVYITLGKEGEHWVIVEIKTTG
ncbi:MAG TPA: hypothetical protein VLA34_13750 [Candidatus Krumholzibacterium sp.]|nr:hypothetical protein [Candidatus Krumholzibacterium sp.]